MQRTSGILEGMDSEVGERDVRCKEMESMAKMQECVDSLMHKMGYRWQRGCWVLKGLTKVSILSRFPVLVQLQCSPEVRE